MKNEPASETNKARQLAGEYSRTFYNRFYRPDLEGMSYAFKGAVDETIVLLRQIEDGRANGQARISENLHKLLDHFDRTDQKNMDDLAFICRDALEQFAEQGISIEGHDFGQEKGKWQQREKQ